MFLHLVGVWKDMGKEDITLQFSIETKDDLKEAKKKVQEAVKKKYENLLNEKKESLQKKEKKELATHFKKLDNALAAHKKTTKKK